MLGRTIVAAAAAFALVGASNAGAQTIGFKVGASFAKWDFETATGGEDLETLTAFMGGGFVRFGLGRVGLQPELLVVTRGGEYPAEAFEGDAKLKVDYIEVPVLLIVPLTMGTGVAPYVFGGPSFAFEINCKVETSAVSGDASEDCSDNDLRESTDIGATAGGGLSFPMGPGDLFVEGRYNWGLTNLAKGEGTEIKSRTGAVLAGYSIWLGQR